MTTVPWNFTSIIYDALESEFGNLPRDRDDAPHDTLIRFFRTLPSRQQRFFADAAGEVLGQIPSFQENAHKFVTLLFVVQIAKSSKSEFMVRKLLADHVLERYAAEQIALRTHLVITAAKYGIDAWLTDFIFENAPKQNDLEHILNCLRVLSWRPDSKCTEFLTLIVPLITDDYSKMLERTLEACMERLGGRFFLDWMHDHLDRLNETYPSQMGILKRTLLGASHRRSEDAYAKLLLLELNAENKLITAEEIVGFAGLPPLVRESDVESLLLRMRRSKLNVWDLVTKNDLMARVFPNSQGPVLLCHGPGVPLNRTKQASIIARLDRSLGMSLKEQRNGQSVRIA